MFSWHAIPFARILLPYIAGILLATYQSQLYSSIVLILLVSAICFTAYATILKRAYKLRFHLAMGIYISMCIACCAYTRTYFSNELRQDNHYSILKDKEALCVRVSDAVVEKAKYYRCYAAVESICDSAGNQHPCKGMVLLYLKKNKHFPKSIVGDRMLIRSNLSPIPEPLNPCEFDYRKYLAQRNIFHQTFVDSHSLVAILPSQKGLYRYACQIRDMCLDIIKQHINSKREAGVAEALLLGYKDDLDPDVVAAFSRTGTLHVLAVSGMHAGIIFLIISFLTGGWKGNKYGRWLQVAVLLSSLWAYAFMTGLSSSVLRATVMFSIISIGKSLRYRPNIYNVIYASAFLLLLYDPMYLLDVGFQLSYTAVLGIVLIQPMVSKWYEPTSRIGAQCWGLLSVSLAAQILTFPLSVYYFNQFPNYFLLSNFVIIPLTSLALLGLVFLVCFSWIPVAGSMAGKLLCLLIRFSDWVVEEIDALPYSYTSGLHLSMAEMCIIYLLIFLLLAFAIHQSAWMMMGTLVSMFILTSLSAINSYYQNRQHKMVIHTIKGHDVFTCIAGKRAYIISDENFIKNRLFLHYHIEPWLWENGVNQITVIDLQKDFFSPEIMVLGGVGYQFFDNSVTMQNSVHNSVQKGQIIVLDHFDKSLFKKLKSQRISLIISNKMSFKKKTKFLKKYFDSFGDSLKLNPKAIVFFD